MKASLVGSSVTIIVQRGDLLLGTWQGVYLCEFDGPRTRTVQLKAILDPVDPPPPQPDTKQRQQTTRNIFMAVLPFVP